MDTIKLINEAVVLKGGKPEILRDKSSLSAGKAKTMAYRIMAEHNTVSDGDSMHLKFDSLISHDITYVGIIQTARASGLKEFPIAPGSHTLNAKAAARIGAAKLGGKLEDYNIVVCHLGGGTSTSAHCKGKLIDSTSDGYSAERAGGVPFMSVIGFVAGCFSGKYTHRDILKMIMGGGGLVNYLGTSDLREVERRIDAGDAEAKLAFDGMVYAQAKDIGAMSTTMNMDIDAIVLTGGMANSKRLVEALSARVSKIAPIIVVPGSHEMDSLATGAIRVMNGEEPYHKFGKDRSEDEYVK